MLAGEKLFEDQRPFCGSRLLRTVTQADIRPLTGLEVGIHLNEIAANATAGASVASDDRGIGIDETAIVWYPSHVDCPFWNDSNCVYLAGVCNYYGGHCGWCFVFFCCCG
jgi:hypothetical protein